MKEKIKFKIREINEKDREWIRKFIIKKWGSEKSISRGKVYYPHKLPGFIVFKDKKYLGLITYNIKKDECEIQTLNSVIQQRGIGTALVERVKKVAEKLGCKRIWLITTNDNIDALRFWQERGFLIEAVYPNAMSFSRKLKPEIPLIGNYGIPIRDEIKLELKIRN